MHLHTYVMLRCCTFSCTCTHTSCYAAVRSHALAHIRHATLLYVLMHLHTYVMLGCCTFSCTCSLHLEKWACQSAISRVINMQMMMMMMKLLLMLKFRFQRFVVPPVKCLKSDNSGGPLKCPAPCFSFLGWLWFFKWLSAGFFLSYPSNFIFFTRDV